MKLRKWKMTDLDSLVKYANNPRIAANLTDAFPYPYTEDNGKSFIEMANDANPTFIFCIDVDGEAVGAIGLHIQGDIHVKNMELGYWLAEPFWGKGIMTEAIKEMVEYGFKTWDITRIYARPFGRNIGSQTALERAGFTLEARFEKTLYKNHQFEDELVYAIRK